MVYSGYSLTLRNVRICIFLKVGKSLDWSPEINIIIYLQIGIYSDRDLFSLFRWFSNL